MERGFDKLMTPEGVVLVTGAMFLLTAMIVFGAVYVRLLERAKSREKEDRDA